MSAKPAPDRRSLSDLRQNPRAVLQRLHRTQRPVVITVDGTPEAVLLDLGQYTAQLRLRKLADLLAEGEEDIRRGRTRTARAAFREIRRAKKAPR